MVYPYFKNQVDVRQTIKLSISKYHKLLGFS